MSTAMGEHRGGGGRLRGLFHVSRDSHVSVGSCQRIRRRRDDQGLAYFAGIPQRVRGIVVAVMCNFSGAADGLSLGCGACWQGPLLPAFCEPAHGGGGMRRHGGHSKLANRPFLVGRKSCHLHGQRHGAITGRRTDGRNSQMGDRGRTGPMAAAD